MRMGAGVALTALLLAGCAGTPASRTARLEPLPAAPARPVQTAALPPPSEANPAAMAEVGSSAESVTRNTVVGSWRLAGGGGGMPANDGTPRVWFSVLTPGNGLRIEHVALAYDHAAAARDMRAAGLEGYAAALETGSWPSCDVLPPAERKAAGAPLVPGAVTWRRGDAHEPAWPAPAAPARLDSGKFRDPAVTAKGEPRARVALN